MTPNKAIHQDQGGVMCLTVDVCSSPTGAAASLFVLPLPLPFWQLADDNRWQALTTSSQRKMNSYPASSGGISPSGRGRTGRQAENAPLLLFKQTPPPSFIHLSDM